MTKIGFVILNYNDSETTTQLIDNISNYESIDHIVIVDNCSTDESYEVLKKNHEERCDVIKTDFNGGYAYGNNYGFKYLEQRYNPDIIFIANPDIEFPEEYIDTILKQFAKHPTFSILSGISIEANGEKSKGYWDAPSYLDSFLSSFILYRIHKNNRKKIENSKWEKERNTKTHEIIGVEAIQGSFLAIKSEVFKKIGYMDEGTFLFYEENILAKKLAAHGYKSGIIDGLYYKHNHSVSIKKTLKAVQTYKIHLQSKRYYEINYNSTSGIKLMLLDLVSKYSIVEKFLSKVLEDLYNSFNLNKRM